MVTGTAQKRERVLGLSITWSVPTLLFVAAMLLGNPAAAAARTDPIGGNIVASAGESCSLDNPYVPSAHAYKVQLHCHTSTSDGADSPLTVQTAYKDFGYVALAVTDHDYLSPDPGSGISHINAVEETSSADHHILHINASRNVPSAGDQATINSIVSAGELAFLCHPNWKGNHWPVEIMLGLRNFTGIEIYNALVAPNQNAEAKWDQLLTSGQHVLGIAVDDAHTAANRNKAWVVVYSSNNSSAALVQSLRTGNFIATQGPNIRVTVDGLTIMAATESPSLIEFVKMNGVAAASATGATSASYTVRGDELYIRIRVTRDSDGKKAWTNPIWENIQAWIMKWTFDVRPIVDTGFAHSNLLLADLDCDGLQEALVGTSNGGRMVAVGPTGRLLWAFPPLDSDIRPQHMSKVQSADDIDGDGRSEVLLSWGTAPDGAVVCINWQGTVKWIFPEPQADFRYGSVLARDFDRDGKKEIVASGNEGKVWVLTHEGKLMWSRTLPPGGAVEGALNIFDVDRDGELEILGFSSSSGNRSGVFHCLDRWGNEEWTWRSSWCDEMQTQPAVGDVNRDGEYEIVLGLRNLDSEDIGGVVILTFYGVELARRYMMHGIGQNAMLADVDEDGRMDILVGADDGFYYCLGPMLEERWAFNITRMTRSAAAPLNIGGALGDVTGDGGIDMVFQSRDNCTLFVLDRFGELATEPYSTESDSTGSVAIGDIDKDGASDILLFAGSNLCCLTRGAPYQARTFVWPMYGRDSTNAGAVAMSEASIGWLGVLASFVAAKVLAKALSSSNPRPRSPRCWPIAYLQWDLCHT